MDSVTGTTASFYKGSLTQMASLRESAGRLQTQIATGEKLERGSDDPVAAARLRSLAREGRLAEIDNANADSVSQSLTSASQALDDMTQIMLRARDLALVGANAATGAEAREALAVEIDELRASLFDFANLTDSTRQALFGGEGADAAYAQDANGAITYVGTASAASVEIGRGISLERGVTGPAAFEFEAGGVTTDAFAFLADLSTALRSNTGDPAATARDSLAGFDAAIDNLGRSQTVLGSRTAWLDAVQFSQVQLSEARAEEEGELGGVDLAETISELQQVLNVLEASQLSFVRLTSLSLFDAL